MGDEGLEPVADSTGNTRRSQTGDAQSDAQLPDSPPIDAGLALVVEHWNSLPAAVRAEIVGMVRDGGNLGSFAGG